MSLLNAERAAFAEEKIKMEEAFKRVS